MKKFWIAIIVAAMPLAACKRQESQPSVTSAAPSVVPTPTRSFSPDSVARGGALFQQDCAQCHGPQAQGHPDWRTPSHGLFTAAPPLNGTGNDWKRSRQQLIDTIKNGARLSDGTPVMPAWKDRLNDGQIADIMAWFQSLWPPEVYDKWSRQQAEKPPQG